MEDFLVNAAFLLVTSALLVGQPGAGEKVPGPGGGDKKGPPPVVVTQPSAGGACCGNSDPCGCEGYGQRLRHRLRGLFNRNNGCCNSQPSCCNTVQSSCCNNNNGFFAQRSHCCHHSAPASSCCDSCDRGGFNLLGKLRERFHRHDSCCDGGCNTGCCGSGGAVAPGKGGEKIDAPKQMPNPGKDKKPGEVRIENHQTFTPNVIQVTPTVPNVEVTPVPAPRGEGTPRDPF